jgi:hypothetical protein
METNSKLRFIAPEKKQRNDTLIKQAFIVYFRTFGGSAIFPSTTSSSIDTRYVPLYSGRKLLAIYDFIERYSIDIKPRMIRKFSF